MEGNRQKDLDCSDLCILVCSYFSKICFGPGFTGQLCQSILSGFVAKIHLMSSSQSWKTLVVCLRGKLMMSEFLQASCSMRHGYDLLQGAWRAWPVSSCLVWELWLPKMFVF